jgi:hypothetical protein
VGKAATGRTPEVGQNVTNSLNYPSAHNHSTELNSRIFNNRLFLLYNKPKHVAQLIFQKGQVFLSFLYVLGYFPSTMGCLVNPVWLILADRR